MNLQKRDKLVKQILCYMKSVVDKNGLPINCVNFDFSMSKVKQYFNSPDEIQPDGEDLVEFRKQCRITNEELDEVMKYCNSMGYAHSINFERVELTEEGRVLALSVEQAKLHKKFPTWIRDILIAVSSSIITAILLTMLHKYWGINGG